MTLSLSLSKTANLESTPQGKAAPPDSEPSSLPENNTITQKRPTLPELLRFKIPKQVGANYKTFGIFLLDDATGSTVDGISTEIECQGRPDRITTRILQEWVGGRGAALTWDTLVKTLRDCEFNVLANHIQASKLPHAP